MAPTEASARDGRYETWTRMIFSHVFILSSTRPGFESARL